VATAFSLCNGLPLVSAKSSNEDFSRTIPIGYRKANLPPQDGGVQYALQSVLGACQVIRNQSRRVALPHGP